jgi:hypothetical protein
VTGAVFVGLIIVVEPLFIFMFALFFKCTGGDGCCVRVAALMLIGNGHRNVINGILYELNH